MLDEFDVAIVFSVDKDLIPALRLVFHKTRAHVEIAAWSGKGAAPRALWFPELKAEGKKLPYCHFLSETEWQSCRDHTRYV